MRHFTIGISNPANLLLCSRRKLSTYSYYCLRYCNLFFVYLAIVFCCSNSPSSPPPVLPILQANPSQTFDLRHYSVRTISSTTNSSSAAIEQNSAAKSLVLGTITQQIQLLANIMRTSCSASATFLDTNHESTQQYHNYGYNTMSPSSSRHHQTTAAGGHTTGYGGGGDTMTDENGQTLMPDSHVDNRFDPRRDAEYRLIRDLLSGKLHGLTNGYDRNVRPTRYVDTKLNISFGVLLSQVMDLDEKNQILTTSCWLNENWLDAYLSWDPTLYGNVTVIRLPANTIWKPDILLYNNADATYYRNTIATNAIVDNSGFHFVSIQLNRNVSLLTTSIYKSACRIDVQYFPFDQQVCNLSFGSWTFETRQLDLTLPTTEGDLSQYMENTEWNLTSMKAIREEVIFSCCPNDPYTFVHIEITMRRRPLFYVFNLILPCILITGLALLGFYTPSESGEKVTLGITTLLSLTVFLMFVGESMPPTSDTLPLIGVYYGVTIIVVSIATSLTVLTLNMHHCGNHGRVVPGWLSTAVLGYLAPALLIRVDWSENLPNSPFYGYQSHRRSDAQQNAAHQRSKYGAVDYDNNNNYAESSTRSAWFACCRDNPRDDMSPPPHPNTTQRRLDNGMLKNNNSAEAATSEQQHATTTSTTAFTNIITTEHGKLLLTTCDDVVVGRQQQLQYHRPHCHHQQHAAAATPYHQHATDEDDVLISPQQQQNVLLVDTLVDVESDISGGLKRRRAKQHNNNSSNNRQTMSYDNPAASTVLRTLAYNEARFLMQERLDSIKTEWQLVAMVIDRFLLIIFVISTFAVSSYILLRSPYMWS